MKTDTVKTNKTIARRGRLAAAVIAGTAVLMLGACNTVKGAGEDITSVGQAGDDAINQ